MFFYVKENKVFLDKLYEVIPEIIKLKETLEPDKLDRAFQYLHFVYSRKSSYFRLELNDRRKTVCADRFGEDKIEIWQKIENNADIKACIDKMFQMQFTENERFVEMARLKISEYITFWSKNKVSEANADIIRKQLEGVKDLINVKREFERNVMEDGLKKKEKSEDTKLFELPD